MVSCKECLHYDVCEARIVADENFPERKYTDNNNCSNFKDRTRFVELPSVNLPVKVYLSDDIDRNYVLRDYYYVKDSGIFMMIINCIETQKSSTRKLNEYHKTVFLTREAAEKALKERT